MVKAERGKKTVFKGFELNGTHCCACGDSAAGTGGLHSQQCVLNWRICASPVILSLFSGRLCRDGRL